MDQQTSSLQGLKNASNAIFWCDPPKRKKRHVLGDLVLTAAKFNSFAHRPKKKSPPQDSELGEHGWKWKRHRLRLRTPQWVEVEAAKTF